jgi:ABC-type uncharacterized transport system permease subunit
VSSVLPLAALAAGAILYAASGILFFLGVARHRATSRASIPPPGSARRLPAVLLGAGIAAHATYVCLASFVQHVCPVHSVHFLLSVTSIVAGTVYLLARVRFHIEALGVIIAPLGLAFLLSTFFLGRPEHSQQPNPTFLAVHVLVNLLGIALFVLAGAAAILYLLQERRLKQKRPTGMGQLPPLDALDRAEHRFLVAGFPLLTVGVLSGTLWARQLEFGNPDEVGRIVFGYATWLLVASVLLLRAAAGWRGRRAAYGTIAGLCCAMAVVAIYLARPYSTAITTTEVRPS